MVREIGAPPRTPTPATPLLAAALAHAAALAVAAMVLTAAGQPLFTDDIWWHLSMGEAYTAQGPWLAADPALHTAAGPPAPAAWLADVALHLVVRATGFQGLRALHVALVAAILALAWSTLRRASDSTLFASLGAALFATLCAYRLFQLRPHLLTILAALLLFRLLLEKSGPPSWRRVAGATALLALWANAHGGFVLGLALLAAAAIGLALAAALRPERRAGDLARARRLAAALALGLLASLANPSGPRAVGLTFSAGRETPELEVVGDEWVPVRLLALPVARLPPTPLAWAGVWALLLATPCAVLLHARRRRREADCAPLDPALLAVAAACAVPLLSAVRFLWLGIFPLLAAARSARALGALRGPTAAWAAALGAALIAPGFAQLGDWPMISRGVRPSAYAKPYPAQKYYAHAVWFLRDAGLEGNLFNDYRQGNFLGYWLAPRLRVFVNGSLNFPIDVMRARHAVLARRGAEPGERFLELLDRLGVDVFFGTGTPVVPAPPRFETHTTAHLEGAPGWIPVFRNLSSAVYLRRNARNLPNLERVADHYAREEVPFDPEVGFDVRRVTGEAPDWAVDHGLLPADFELVAQQARSLMPAHRHAAQERLAAVYATLGLYPQAAAIDRRRLRTDPDAVTAARRLVWSLLHERRAAEALDAAARLEALAGPGDALSRALVHAARRRPELSEDEAAAQGALLPILTREQRDTVFAVVSEPEARD